MVSLRKSWRGQAMVEYGMTGWFLLVAIIPCLVVLGFSLASIFSGVKSDLTGQAVQSAWPESKGAGTIHLAPDAGTGTAQVTITLGNGQVINLDNYVLNTSQSLEVMGANGTSDLMGNLIIRLANELLALEEITESQANALFSLANQLHLMASMEAIVENTMARMPETMTPHQTGAVSFNGQSYENLWVLSSDFGQTGLNEENYGRVNGPVNQQFLDLYGAALDSGALRDPAVASIINSYVTDAFYIAEALESAAFYTGDYPPSEMKDHMNEYYSRLQGQPLVIDSSTTISNMNASAICTSGGGTDDGTFCSP